MVMNADKFSVIRSDKRNIDHNNEHINCENWQIEVVSFVKLLGLQIDNKLNFNLLISNICKSTARKLNVAIIRLENFISWKKTWRQLS